jgi:hypothetical protein
MYAVSFSGQLAKKMGLRVKSFQRDGERVYAIRGSHFTSGTFGRGSVVFPKRLDRERKGISGMCYVEIFHPAVSCQEAVRG